MFCKFIRTNFTFCSMFLFSISSRLSGLSPFMGENDNDTYANINRANYDFDDESFTDISDEAKDFISKLLVKDKE